MDCNGLVVENNDFLQVGQEQICEFDMGWMRYILCNAFHALEGWLEDMSETLMHVLNAHILALVTLHKISQVLEI